MIREPGTDREGDDEVYSDGRPVVSRALLRVDPTDDRGITGNNVKMTRPIEDLVFYEK